MTRLLALIITIFLFACQSKTEVFELYVGNSSNTLAYGEGKNNTFLTISEALNQAKILKAENPAASVNINLLPGEYHLSQSIVLTAEMSGISIIGTSKDEVIVKGSQILNLDFEPYNDNIYVSPVPESVSFDQLIVNGSKQVLARYPDYDENGGHWQGHAPDAFSPERIATWKNPKTAIVHVMHGYEWGDFHYEITGIDSVGQPIMVGGHQNNRPAPMHKTYRMVENVFEELNNPGEWYLDKASRKLYFWPPSNQDLKSSTFEGVTLKNLITIQGISNKLVSDIIIENITFQHAQRTVLEEYEPLLRSDWTIFRGGAVFLENTKNVSIKNCVFSDLGGNAIFVSGRNTTTKISENHIFNVDASGVSFVGRPEAVRSPSFQYSKFVPMNEMDTIRGPKTNQYPHNSIVDNNLIHRTGRLEKQTAGVEISMAMNITVSRNSIYDVPRAGINIGDGTWGGHIIEYNDVFNTVLESGDHGSFNSWGRDRFWHPNRRLLDSLSSSNPKMPLWDAVHTTIIRNNRFRCDHGWDIDLDDGSSNYEIYNNLCLNGGIKLREGFYRTVYNNILVNNGFHPHVWFENSGDVFKKNIVSSAHRDIRLNGWGKEIDFNLFPDEESLQSVRAHDIDKNSAFGNPRFVNPNKGNFAVEENSPAIILGFTNFPMDTFGVQKPELKELAKTPEIPQMIIGSEITEDNKQKVWLGFTLKNIETLAERSASGLSEEAGVIILSIEENSVASKSELQKGDVIIEAEGKKIKSSTDLLKVYQEHNWKGKLNLVLFRNQKEMKSTLVTK